MSIHSRIVQGIGYGALAVATLGFVVAETATLTSQQSYSGGGYSFTPSRNYSHDDTHEKNYLLQAMQEDEEMIHLIAHVITKGLLQ